MSIRLKAFACPVCKDGTLVEIKIKKSALKRSNRFPVLVTAKCPKSHNLVLFVDASYQVRDVEVALQVVEE